MKGLAEESGIVLVMVLWVLALLSTIAAHFTLSTHTENQASVNHKESVQAYYVARAGMLQTIDRLARIATWKDFSTLKDSSPEVCLSWNRFSKPCGSLRGERYRVMLEDQATKINVNDPRSLHWLDLILKGVDIDQETRSTILDSLLDWHDEDDTARLHGAENSYYRHVDNPYQCKNGDLDTLEELLLVKGMTRNILYGGERNGKVYRGISEFLTVLPTVAEVGKNQVEAATTLMQLNASTCPLDMLSVIFHITPEGLRDIQSKRHEQGYLSPADLAKISESNEIRGVSPLLTYTFPDLIKITVAGLTQADQPGWAISALVRFGTDRRQFEVLEWDDVAEAGHYGAASLLEQK